MLKILTRVFGPHRAVSIYVFLQNRGLVLLALSAFVGIVATLLLSSDPAKHEYEAFLTLPVIKTTAIGNNIGNGLIVTMRLPDGETITVTTAKGEIAKTVAATACVEKRRFLATGEARYRLKLPRSCASN